MSLARADIMARLGIELPGEMAPAGASWMYRREARAYKLSPVPSCPDPDVYDVEARVGYRVAWKRLDPCAVAPAAELARELARGALQLAREVMRDLRFAGWALQFVRIRSEPEPEETEAPTGVDLLVSGLPARALRRLTGAARAAGARSIATRRARHG